MPRRRVIPPETKIEGTPIDSLTNAGGATPPGFRRGRTVGIVGILTLVVSIFGYIREAVLAARFGASSTMDAYFAAVTIPIILYVVLVAGTLSPIFIPILLQQGQAQDRAKASETFSIVTNFMVLVLAVIIALITTAAPLWVPRLFPGFSAATARLAVHLTYIVLPATLFLALAGILTAVLNGFHRFALAAFAPVLSSVLVIVTAMLAHGEHAIYVVGIATAAGFLAQCLLLLPATAALGIRYRPILNLRHPAIRALFRLGVPLLLYLAVSNISGFLERNLASRLSAGAVSILAYAMRLFTVPASFFAAPLAIVAYPQFAHEAARGEKGELPNKISRVIRLVWFVFLPVTVLLMLNALPITRFVYEHGRFSPADSFITARALALYGTGILPNALAIVLLRCFFAIQDTVTPLWAEVVNLGFYAVAAVVMARHFGIAGLALARGAGFFPFAAILVFVLWKRRGLLRLDLDFLNFLWRSVTAAIVLALVNWISMRLFQKWFDGGNAPVRLGIIFGVLLLAGTAFLIVARLLRLDEASQIMSAVRDLMAVRGDRSALISPPEV